ncbi:MAG: transcriptional regulator [Kordiimonadaceae bacterium]|jgi:HTH-type transcriptional regulator / antitoxin HigA|nr:transcriptional regulator [Kordiimonadaceae bacterium]
MDISPIQTSADYNAAMVRIDALMEMNNGEGPPADSAEGRELAVRAIIAEVYEDEAFPMDLPTPVEAVKFALEQQGLEQKDLANILHSKSRASELLSGSLKSLSRRMMQRLHDKLHIPAEILIRDF